MDEISNKTLATLLVVAIVISLAGTFFAMRGVSQVTNYITGAQSSSDSGTAQVNISESLSIVLTQDSVDFGTGQRNNDFPVGSECNISSNESQPSCWNTSGAGGTWGSAGAGPVDFTLENDGNVNAEIQINSTASADFFGTCDVETAITGGDPQYFFATRNTTENGCRSGGNNTWTEFTAVPQDICANLTYDNTNDEVNISIKIHVPAGPAGVCSNTVDFSAAKNY